MPRHFSGQLNVTACGVSDLQSCGRRVMDEVAAQSWGQKESSSMPVHLTKEGFLRTLSEEDARTEDAELVRSFEEWEQRAGSWPLKRLVAIWNDLPGVLAVQKFTSREIALERIWRFLHASEPARQRKG